MIDWELSVCLPFVRAEQGEIEIHIERERERVIDDSIVTDAFWNFSLIYFCLNYKKENVKMLHI